MNLTNILAKLAVALPEHTVSEQVSCFIPSSDRENPAESKVIKSYTIHVHSGQDTFSSHGINRQAVWARVLDLIQQSRLKREEHISIDHLLVEIRNNERVQDDPVHCALCTIGDEHYIDPDGKGRYKFFVQNVEHVRTREEVLEMLESIRPQIQNYKLSRATQENFIYWLNQAKTTLQGEPHEHHQHPSHPRQSSPGSRHHRELFSVARRRRRQGHLLPRNQHQ